MITSEYVEYQIEHDKLPHMTISLQYSHLQLDRCDHLRRQPEAIEQLWQQSECKIIPINNNRHLFHIHPTLPDNIQVVMPNRSALLDFIQHTTCNTFLGIQDGTPYFAIDIADHLKSQLCTEYQGKFIDLRSVGAQLDQFNASILAYARAMVHWHQQNRYCSRCGSSLRVSHGGHIRTCTDDSCALQIYPRTDPAVIMLIERLSADGVPQCLLGRHPQWHKGSFSTLAGFVEPGESPEMAVRREVFEEAGVRVGDVQYIASQPWPFPSSLMLGYIGKAISHDIQLDKEELAEAYWFSREEVASFGEWGTDSEDPKLPRKDSISRFLINHWLDNLP